MTTLTSDLIEATVTGTAAFTTYDAGGVSNTFDVSTMFITNPASGIGEITYEITGGDNIGTISGSTVTLTGVGTITITASVAATSTTGAATGSAVLIVTAA